MPYRHLSIEEREFIQRALWEKRSIRSIAEELGRSHTSIARELRRPQPRLKVRYTPRVAHARALAARKRRGRGNRLKNDTIRAYVIMNLKERWSPEQIAGRIEMDCGETISHEAIYQYIYACIKNGNPSKGTLDLRIYLRRRRKRRQPKGVRTVRRLARCKGLSIEARPQIVNARGRFGDWEGDTVESKDHKPGINTVVERVSGFVMITKLKGKSAEHTIDVLERRFKDIPVHLKHTLTLDNGPENSDPYGITAATGLTVYKAHPYCSGERGTNENTNGLERDYHPKKTDFTIIPDAELAAVEYALNTRPRKRLGFRTPLEVWSGALQG